jgi:RNA-directed DNA polymerase
MSEADRERIERNSKGTGTGALKATAKREEADSGTKPLMEAVVERENIVAAYRKVVGNKGAAGVDGMTVKALKDHLKTNWPHIREELLEGRYEPESVRGVKIPKPGKKGVRQLGIPTVMDRLIQQALHQILQPIYEPGFSESSYGFRPKRNAQQAVCKAREYAKSGKRWVVDLDLEKFFDRVNHDVLMARVERKVKDKGVLKLIRKYLQAGMMEEGLVSPRREGTPQGGPLSPLLSNILLDDLDKELEQRGHRHCRYADDCNIYVESRKAGERVMKSISRYLEERLKLKVNREKSAVGRPWERKFLGYSLTFEKSPRLRIASESLERMKSQIREQLDRGRGRRLQTVLEEMTPKLRGWGNYFVLTEAPSALKEIDAWMRRKVRCILWTQWKTPGNRARNLMKLGVGKKRAWISANNGRGAWWNAGARHMQEAVPKNLLENMGLFSLLKQWQCNPSRA